MNSKWLPLTAVGGFAAILISQTIMPASADDHDDWARRHRNDARYHRDLLLHRRALPVHTGAWHVRQAQESNSRYGRGASGFPHIPPGQWNKNRTDHHDNGNHHGEMNRHDNDDHHDRSHH